MTTSPSSRRVSIAPPAAQALLTPAQKRFNTLVKKIEAQRQALAGWQEAVPIYRQRRAREFDPLLESFRQATGQFARFLEQQSLQGGLSRAQQAALAEIICTMVEPLVEGDASGEMKALFNRHSDIDHDSIEAEAKASLREMVGDVFGVDIGEQIDLDDPEAVLKKFEQEMLQKQAQAQSAAEEAEAAAPKRRPSVHQRRKAQEAVEAGQSVREVFRKLASALHPDRETDPLERDRKTVLMQRVNQAYHNKDLLTLLTLQLEVEQIDQHHIDAIAEDRLKHYNKVLSEQLEELQMELRGIEDGIRMEFGLDPFQRLAPARLMTLLQQDKQALQFDLIQMRNEQRRLVDKQQLKRWIKQQQAMLQDDGDEFDLFR